MELQEFMMFISYERKGDAGYAKLNTAVRKGGKRSTKQ